MSKVGKGGPLHKSKPQVDVDLLFRVFSSHGPLMKLLGPYEHVSRSHAVDPKGLVHLYDLLKSLVKICPSGEIAPVSLKGALLRLLTDDCTVNDTKYAGQVWVGLRADRLTTVLCHLRRVARDPEAMKQCCSKLTGFELAKLQEVAGMIELRDQPEQPSSSQLRQPSSSQVTGPPAPATAPYSIGGSPAQDLGSPVQERTNKRLKRSDSAVSTDSQGYPLMLRSPCQDAPGTPKEVPHFLRPRLGRHTQASSSGSAVAPAPAPRQASKQPLASEDLRAALGFGPPVPKAKAQPKAQAKGKAKAKAKAKPQGKAKAQAKGKAEAQAPQQAEAEEEHAAWVGIRRTNAQKPERSYLQGREVAGGPWKLIVECSKAKSTHYSLIIDKIEKKLREEDISKEEAVALRESLVGDYE